MKIILVPVGGSNKDEVLFETALALARHLEAHLQFLHVRIGAGEAALNVAHTEFAMGPALHDALEKLDQMANVRSETASQHFYEFCRESMIQICDEVMLGKLDCSWVWVLVAALIAAWPMFTTPSLWM